jgi:hypothetical protein
LILGVLLASPAAAQVKINLNNATCEQFLEMPRDHMLITLGWLRGYFLEENAEPVVDFGKVLADLPRLTEYCKGSLDEEVMTAAEELFGKQAPAAPEPDNPPPPR